jgi:phage gp36-like protein
MAYCTQDDLLRMIPLAELAELTAEAGDIPDSSVVADAIAKADAEIDSYLGVRYQVPLSPVPARVKALSVDMAIFHLYSRRSVIPAARRQQYETALAFLEQVAKSQAVVEGAGPGSDQGVMEPTSAVRIFTRDILGEW